VSSSDPLVDKLTIETPEQTPLEFPLAGIGSRFLAVALDTLIQSAAITVLVLLVLLVGVALSFRWREVGNWTLALGILAFFVIYYGYFAIFEAVWNGQTPGKRYTRLRVIQDSGRPISVYQSVARNLIRFVDQLPAVYAIGIVAAMFNRQSKRLGDFVAGTVVVHEKPLQEVELQLPAAGPPVVPRFQGGRLSAEDLQLIESFLERRARLSTDLRAQMGQQIAERFAQRLAIPLEERPPAEAFLEALAREKRAAAGFR
jgi:uncharacterized RDD family membrane protein YckC